MMYEEGFGFVLIVIIALVFSLIALFLAMTIFRRAYNSRKYRLLDKKREFFRNKLAGLFESGSFSDRMEEFIAPPKSIDWLAIEHVLVDMIEEGRYERAAKELLLKLDYPKFYESRMLSNNIIRKASAIDKLGKIRSGRSMEKLVGMMDVDDPEIISVTARSLGRIGAPEGLQAILTRTPRLLSRNLATRKTVETVLKNFGASSVPTLIGFGSRFADPASKASLLEVLSNMGAREALPFAAEHLGHPDAEVRSKALKVIGAVGTALTEPDMETVRGCLDDPVWFVRLQAAKALGILKCLEAEDALAERLLDGNWQVRNAAAMALAGIDHRALEIFLRTLESTDDYAKESICEEIEKTEYVGKLIENLDSADPDIHERSRNILRIMCSLHYSTPLREYLKTGTNERIRKHLEFLVGEETAA